MRFAARTHAGRRGGQNEDSLGWDEARALWFVADGMGGHASGDVASRIVKDTLLATSEPSLEAAVLNAHRAIVAAARTIGAVNNMGSTIVAGRIADGTAEIVWVGDSRAYLWREGALRQITRDHSYLEVLREEQKLSEAQLRGHPQKNLVTQTLGLGEPRPATLRLALRNGDRILFCSDGLNDELEDREIAAALQAHATPEAAAEALIAAALAHGGRDNVSVIVVEHDGADGLSFAGKIRGTSQAWLPIVVGVLAAFAIAAVFWFVKRASRGGT